MNNIQYYDIGLNLFCKQFPNPKEIVKRAAQAGVCCILTGTDRRENRLINEFVRKNDVLEQQGFILTMQIRQEKRILKRLSGLLGKMTGLWRWESAGLILTGCFLQRRIRFDVWKSILCWLKS